MTYRIQHSNKADANVFAPCGEIDTEHTKRLQEPLEPEKETLVLLGLNQLVGCEATEILASVKAAEIYETGWLFPGGKRATLDYHDSVMRTGSKVLAGNHSIL